MKTVTAQSFTPLSPAATHWSEQPFPPLEQVTSPTVPTDAAAYYLNRKPQTMRSWASTEQGPIRPIRINKRLAWPVVKLLALLGGKGGAK